MALIRPTIHLARSVIGYDGTQLRSHWIYESFGIRGDAVAAFVGPVDVRGDHLVDLADRRDSLFIAGDSMLHFIVESFGADLDRGALFQRVLIMLARERLEAAGASGLRRTGDDLWLGSGKITVSIATVSPVSCLIHFGVNVTNDGTPVETASLADLGVDPYEFAQGLLEEFAAEIAGIASATTKVRGVL